MLLLSPLSLTLSFLPSYSVCTLLVLYFGLTYVTLQAVRSVWKGEGGKECTLAQVFEVKSLDEDMLFGLTVLLMDRSGGVSVATKHKALVQIKACSGLEVVVNFLLSDESVQLDLTDISICENNSNNINWKSLYLSA